jgi:serine/threonine-protein kinase RsbW
MNVASTLRIPAKVKNLRAIRRFVEERATALGVAPDALYDVILAVDEATTNIMVHGYRGQPGLIEVQVEREGDSLVVRLRDRATPFDPHDVPPPDLSLPLEERPIGGMGIYMMKQLVDQVTHLVPPQGGNELSLIKKGIVKHSEGGAK